MNPFSRSLGTKCLVPGSSLVVEAFPTRIFVGEHILDLPRGGQNFLVEQDLQKNEVRIASGTHRVRVGFARGGVSVFDRKEELLHIPHIPPPQPPKFRLFLGSHKKLDWTRVMDRCSIAEFLPILSTLGQKYPKTPSLSLSLETKRDWEVLFRAAFSDILVPRREDTDFQGLAWNPLSLETDPLSLFPHIAKRSIDPICQEREGEILLLQNPWAASGRVEDFVLQDGSTLSFLWRQNGIVRGTLVQRTNTCYTLSTPLLWRRKGESRWKRTPLSSDIGIYEWKLRQILE